MECNLLQQNRLMCWQCAKTGSGNFPATSKKCVRLNSTAEKKPCVSCGLLATSTIYHRALTLSIYFTMLIHAKKGLPFGLLTENCNCRFDHTHRCDWLCSLRNQTQADLSRKLALTTWSISCYSVIDHVVNILKGVEI